MSTAPDSERLVDQSLGRIFRILERMRWVGAALLCALAVLFTVHDEPLWKALLAAGAAVTLGLMAARHLRRVPETYAPAGLVALLASILGTQFIVITLTGGIRSPFLVVAAPLVLGLATGTRGGPWLKVTFGVIVMVPLVFGLGDVLGWWPPDALVPAALARHDDGPAPGYATAAMLAVATIMLTTAIVGGYLRRTVKEAVDTTMEARAETLASMRARQRELESLSGALAHELKNPLASIQGLGVLLARKLPEGSREAERMGVLLGEVQRMSHILDEFLNFSRPTEGLQTTAVPVARLVSELLDLHEADAAQREVRLSGEVRSAATLLADGRKLKQVLVNLIQNALEASAPGGVVQLRVSDDGDDVVFEVRDEGPGLDPAIAHRLFEVGATSKPTGTGLGLVIARGITEQHGGRLSLENRSDRGGCVARMVLPRRAGPRPEGEAA